MFLCRMSDRGGEADQRLQPGSEVHRPHGGTKVQSKVQDGSGELAVQLLQKHLAAGHVRSSHQSLSQSILNKDLYKHTALLTIPNCVFIWQSYMLC